MRASFALAILASCAEQSAVPPVPTGALASEPLPPAKPAPPPSVAPPPARQDIPTATPEELSVPVRSRFHVERTPSAGRTDATFATENARLRALRTPIAPSARRASRRPAFSCE
jgi:hypothetical protein